MSGNSQASRIGLDARAAELKEKLLKSRSQSQTRLSTAQSTPDPAKASTNVSVPAPSRVPSSGGPSASSSHPLPDSLSQQPTRASVQADANDIAALISSISAASEIPGLGTRPLSNGAHKPQAEQAAPANDQALSQHKPLPSIPVKTPAQPAVERNSEQSQQQPKSEATAPSRAPPGTGTGLIDRSPPKEGEIACRLQRDVDSSKNSEQTVSKAADTKTPAAAAVSKNNGLQAPASSNDHQEPARDFSVQTAAKTCSHDLTCRDSGSKTRTAASEPAAQAPEPTGTSKKEQGNGVGQAVSSRTDIGRQAPPSASGPATSDDTLARLLAHAPDLKDWLELTDYYNVEIRKRKLDRFRRAKALAAEKLRIEEEERKLMEEEELEMGLQRSTVLRLASAVPSAPAGSESASLPTPLTPAPAACEIKEPAQATAAKRTRDGDDDSSEVRKKMARTDDAPSRAEESDGRSRHSDRRDEEPEPRHDSMTGRTGSRPRPPSRDASPRRRPHAATPPARDYRRSPPPRSRDYSPPRQSRLGPRPREEYGDYDERHRKYDRYTSGGIRYLGSPRRRDSGHHHVTYPVRIDLGRKGGQYFGTLPAFSVLKRLMKDQILASSS